MARNKRDYEPEAQPTDSASNTVRVRLRDDCPYGRVVIGHTALGHGETVLLDAKQFEELADDYGLELAPEE